MEASGTLNRSLHSFSCSGFDNNSFKSSVCGVSIDAGKRFSGEFRLPGCRDSSISLKPRKPSESFFPGFLDNGHLKYYALPTTCSKVCKKEKSETLTIKKKLKHIKGLSKNLLVLSSGLSSPDIDNDFVGDDKRTISEATEVLFAQLKKLRVEEKELKRRRKEEKAKMKATLMKARDDNESSSSSSSETSDGECEQVVNMKNLSNMPVAEPQSTNEIEGSVTTTSLHTLEQRIAEVNQDHSLKSFWNRDSKGEGSSVVVGASVEKIEVCMGGKCKKLGAPTLLEEFQTRVGVEGAVVGCKCMGKCTDGPNVRVLNVCDKNSSDGMERSVRPATNPVCLGVGLENVGDIVANFFGDGSKDMGLMAT
ncbi:diacylglycerol O-acyltransferase 3 [Macadamia integrifolia]|uniref:diacylglycerol O-acyltransferase 3 n=1 Tax=Macadamia integrifolia TaxID=60698 RepID=UPI001C502541|nr:diacylglycerol O-acyltransferase 3 [Macadamia integrifolia]